MNCALCGAEALPGEPLCAACSHLTSARTVERLGSPPTATLGRGGRASLSFPPGAPFGPRYTIVEEVGAGGMGQVYKALDRKLGKTVALKLIRPDISASTEALERFRRELGLAQQVSHPNVCRVHDLGEVEGIHYISMEYVEGQTLEDLIRAVGHLSPRQTVGLGRQICAGLRAIHEKGIVHRDLKPGNVMVDRGGHALVMDFGLAYRPAGDRLTSAGAILGTLAYLSPEQARSQPTDVRSDVYSLGAMLFEMLTGKRPPGDEGLPLALRDSSERCPPPSRVGPEVPSALDAVVLRCLERDPARRFQTVEELDQALARVAAALSSGVTPAIGAAFPTQGPSRVVVIGTVATTALLLLGILVIPRLGGRPPAPPGPRTVAVLPFAYQGPEASAYLKDLLPLLLDRELRAHPGLEIAPFGSSRTFAPDEDPRSVARQLGVGWVVRGRVRVEGEQYHANLTALSRDEGPEVWTRALAGAVRSPFGEADRVASDLARALGAKGKSSGGLGARSPRALEIYLQGRTDLEGWDVDRNFARAETAFQGAIGIDPDFAEAHAMLALALWTHYTQTREAILVQRALEAAERAVLLAPSLPEAQLAYGVVQLGRGRSAEAASAFHRALELAPADDAVCRRIADAYAALGRNDEAERMYQRAIDLRPSYWENYNAMGAFFLDQGRLDRAKTLFRKVIDLRPDSDIGYGNLAGAHITAGELKEAEPLLEAALKIRPSEIVHNNLGFVYYSTGRFEEAAREFRLAVEVLESAARWGNLGDAYRQLGRPNEARAAYARAIELGRARLRVNPADAKARAALSMRLAGAGRCDEARREAARGAAEGGANPTVHYYAAVAYAICGHRAAAVRHSARAIEGGALFDVRTNPDLKPVLADPALRKVLK